MSKSIRIQDPTVNAMVIKTPGTFTPIATLTTDFGHGSIYVAQLKGVLLSINPQLVLVDVTHDIPPQHIFCGAWLLRQTVPFYPPGSLHLAVVDPGVGTARACLALDWEGRVVIAPDNGLVSLLCELAKPRRVIELKNENYFRPTISHTFHARDIMGPVLAWLSLGVPLEELGPEKQDIVRLPDSFTPETGPREIRGQIVFIDHFGNLITNIDATELSTKPVSHIHVGGYELRRLSRTYGEHQPGELVALAGSHGYLEIAVVNGSAAGQTGLHIGTPVVVRW